MRIVNPLGFLGEKLASDYLVSKGYKIIERNFRKKYEEIDIIALQAPPQRALPRRDSTIVFVEVKTRKSGSYGSAVESVTLWKLRHLARLAQYYKLLHPKLPDDMRIDLIAVTLLSDNKLDKLEHLENITDF